MKRNGTIRRDGDVANCGIALRRGRKRRCGRHVDSRTIRRCTDTREATETDRRFRLRHDAPRLAVFFPQACGKLSSAHTQCQTFLVLTKQSFAVRVLRAIECQAGGDETRSSPPASFCPIRRAVRAFAAFVRASPVAGLRLQILQALNHDQQRAPVLVGAVPRVDDRVAQQIVVAPARRARIETIETA